MKKLFLLLGLVVLSLPAFGQVSTGVSRSMVGLPSLNSYLLQPLVNRLLASNAPPVRVLFLGDSMSAAPWDKPYSTPQSMIRDLEPAYYNHNWAPFNSGWQSFTATTAGWTGTNWWYGLWAMTAGQLLHFPILTNINRAEMIWFQQPNGNASLGIYTNFVLCKTVNGFSPTWKSAYTNFALPTGNYTLSFGTISGTETNSVSGATGANTNEAGFEFFYTTQGGTTISNILQCGTNNLYPYYSGINPDIVIYHAKDWTESGCTTISGLTNTWLALYNTLNPLFTNATWVIVGTPDTTVGGPGDGSLVNAAMYQVAKNRGLVYASAFIPLTYYSNYFALDGLHPNSMGANVMAAAIEQELGLVSPLGAFMQLNRDTLPLLNNNGSGLTNVFNLGNGSGGVVLTTNSVAPGNTTTIRVWVTVTNAAGGVFKMPLYQ